MNLSMKCETNYPSRIEKLNKIWQKKRYLMMRWIDFHWKKKLGYADVERRLDTKRNQLHIAFSNICKIYRFLSFCMSISLLINISFAKRYSWNHLIWSEIISTDLLEYWTPEDEYSLKGIAQQINLINMKKLKDWFEEPAHRIECLWKPEDT